VGHEVDVTLTDFAADARAATPSQAAEMVVPDLSARRDALRHSRARLRRAASARIDDATRRLHRVERRIEDPRLLLAGYQQTLDDRVEALEGSMQRPIDRGTEQLRVLDRRLAGLHPSVRIADESRLVAGLASRLATTMRGRQRTAERQLHRLAAGLDAMSPLRVLARGYAIATTPEGRAVRRAAEVKEGDSIDVRLAEGRLSAKVTTVVARGEETAPPERV
jgi:exodeoxyribonuclease VII large subunit